MVFSTKERETFLKPKNKRFKVFQHIKRNAKEKDIWLDCINGYEEHAHCLISLRAGQCINDVVQAIKGESSLWINNEKIFEDHFNWQREYWAVSVSESHLDAVRRYIHTH